MASRIRPLDVQAPPPGAAAAAIPPPAAQPEVADDPAPFQLSFLWLLAPMIMFLLYVSAAHFAVNHGGVEVTGSIKDKAVTVTTDISTVTLGADINMSVSLIKTGKVHPIPDLVSFNLTLANLKGHPISTFASTSYNMSTSEMNVRFEPHQTHLPDQELVLLVERHLRENKLWLILSSDFKWHIKERKIELGLGGYKHARFECSFPAFDGNYKEVCH